VTVGTGEIEIEAGRHVYPTPRGEIHVDRELDEITLMRLVTAAANINAEWRWVARAKIGPTMIGLEVIDHDGDLALRDEHDELAKRWFWHTDASDLHRPCTPHA
jgi:hypothetical protein